MELDQLCQNIINGLKQISNTSRETEVVVFPVGVVASNNAANNHEHGFAVTCLERSVTSCEEMARLPKILEQHCYEDGVLSLPISGLAEEFKCATMRLDVALTDSQAPVV